MQENYKSSLSTAYQLLERGGDLGELIKHTNWTITDIGPIEKWPQSFRTALGIVLSAYDPMLFFWGKEQICFYNDAFRKKLGDLGNPIIGIGRPGKELLPNMWSFLENLIFKAQNKSDSTSSIESKFLYYNDVKKEVQWKFCISIVIDEEGFNGGTIITCIDTTENILSNKRLKHSDQRFINLIKSAAAGIVVLIGKEMKVEIVNEAFSKMVAQPSSKLINQPLFNILPEAKEIFQPILENVYTKGETINLYDQPCSVSENGTQKEIIFNIEYQPYVGLEGKIIGVMIICRDVTLQILSQKKIENSERNLRALFSQTPVAMCLLKGVNMIIEIANNSALHYLDQKSEDIIGKSIFSVVPLQEKFQERLLNVYHSGQSYTDFGVEFIVPRKGKKEVINFNFVYEPYREPDGEISGIMVVATEVTAETRARRRIEESEQRLRSVVESTPFPIGVLIGKQMRIQLANQAMIKAWGNVKDVIGSLYHDILPESNKEAILKQVDEVYRTGIPYHANNQKIELVLEGKLQSNFFNYSFTPLFDGSKEIYGVIHTAADVTDLAIARQEIEKSEERFRIMADAAPNMVWALHPDGSQRYLNTFGLNYLGLTLEEHIQKNWVPFIHPDDLAPTRVAALTAIQNRVHYMHEQRLLRHDGKYRWFISQGSPCYYPNGDLYGYVGTSIDITELKLANGQLIKINNDLDNFIYTASHDLKSPMSNIEGLLTSLKENLHAGKEKITEDTDVILQFMEKSIGKFKSTIQDLTEITKVRKGLAEDVHEVDLFQLVEDIQVSIFDKIKESSAKICVDFSKAQILTFSRKNLKSIVFNLLSNAIKYRDPKRKCEINLRTEIQDNYIVLSIQDNGLGIPKHSQGKMFTMFKRFHDHVEGTGVGLYIVKRIVDNAGGKIEVQSEEGIGTCIKIYIKN